MRRLPAPAALVAMLFALPATAEEWKQFAAEDGVVGFSRSVPGSRVLELRSVVVVDARIEVVGAVLRNVEGLKRPGSSCYEARYLARPDRDHYTFLVAYQLPGPFADRVAVVDVANRYDLDHGRAIATLHAVARPPVPIKRGAVLITEFESEFVIEYLGREKTGVIVTSRVDPGGWIPAYFANGAARDSLLGNAKSLRAAVRKPEYLAAAASSPDGALAERLVGDREAVRRVVSNRLRELVPDAAMAARLADDEGIVDALVNGDGQVGALLLLGWGSPESRREAVSQLLRRQATARTREHP